MSQSFFYSSTIASGDRELTLEEKPSRHIAQVLRMQAGDEIMLTNGKGYRFESRIVEAGKKKVTVSVTHESFQEQRTNVIIAISPIKNTSRFEWFLEKATEIGVKAIYPIICDRTEKQNLRHDRLNNILISAMLQSKQLWLPELHHAISLSDFIVVPIGDKFIAHCDSNTEKAILKGGSHSTDPCILIGPEGDFTSAEIAKALAYNFQPVSLGDNRLRTETAGIVAVTLLNFY